MTDERPQRRAAMSGVDEEDRRLERRELAGIELLPASPTLLVELRRVMDSGTAGAGDVAELIKGDPGLVATILRLVHSAYYRLPPMANLKTAVAYLGMREVYRMVVAASVVNAFRHVDGPALRRHWHRAYVAASLARDLTRSKARFLSASEGWIVGLLHDVGNLVRMVIEPDKAWALDAARARGNVLAEDAERALDLPPSPALGAALCRAWRLPTPLGEVCAGHRRGQAEPGADERVRAFTPLVGAAALLTELVTGELDEDDIVRVRDRVKGFVGVDDDGFWSLVADAREQLTRASAEVDRTLAPKS